MTLFNKVGREFNDWLDKKLDGWRGTDFLYSIQIVFDVLIFCGIILFITWEYL